jgi:hypothetical protein
VSQQLTNEIIIKINEKKNIQTKLASGGGAGLLFLILLKDAIGIMIKMLTNYLQILGSLSSFEMNMPSAFSGIINTTGNPSAKMAYIYL